MPGPEGPAHRGWLGVVTGIGYPLNTDLDWGLSGIKHINDTIITFRSGVMSCYAPWRITYKEHAQYGDVLLYHLFTARRFASAVLATAIPSVRPSHDGFVSKRRSGVTRVFGARGQKHWSAPPRKSPRQQSVLGQIYHCGCTKPPINSQFCDFPLTAC